MAKLFRHGGSADGEAVAEAEVAAVIDAFGGDARAALRALIVELEILRREVGAVSPGHGAPAAGQWRHRRRHLQ